MKFITLGASLWALSCYVLASHQMFFGSGKYALSMTRLQNEEPSVTSGVDAGLENNQSMKNPFPYMNGKFLLKTNLEY